MVIAEYMESLFINEILNGKWIVKPYGWTFRENREFDACESNCTSSHTDAETRMIEGNKLASFPILDSIVIISEPFSFCAE